MDRPILSVIPVSRSFSFPGWRAAGASPGAQTKREGQNLGAWYQVAIEPLSCLQAALADTSGTTGVRAWTRSAVLQLLRSRRCRR